MIIEGLPELCGESFWNLYDWFCSATSLENFIKYGKSHSSSQMCAVMELAHRARTIHHISRPDRGWQHHKAWLTLRDASIRNDEGNIVINMQRGDVVVVEHGWDRDVFVTHSPIHERTSGYLLSGKWEEMVGLFMPLFDKATILECIKIRTAKNVEEAIARAEKQANEWVWY